MAVLYCVGHAGFLLKALVHKFTYHPKENLVLVLHFKLNKVDYNEIAKYVCFGKFYNIEQANEKNLFSYWEDILKEIDFTQITTTYIMFDVTNNIGAYFEKIGQYYSLIELSANQFSIQSTPKSCPQHQKSSIQEHFDILEKYGVVASQGAHCIKHLNYKLGLAHVPSQDLPIIYMPTFGITMSPREKMIEWHYFHGYNPYKFIISKKESVDIDDELDLAIARAWF